jgi:hypothetical protein
MRLEVEGKNKEEEKMNKLWSYGLIAIFFVNIISLAVIAGQTLPAEDVFELNDDAELEDHEFLENSGLNNKKYNEFEINFDYYIEGLYREGQYYKRLILNNGAMECGNYGEEKLFYLCSIESLGELSQITVVFSKPTSVPANPIPYLVPQKLGSTVDKAIFAPSWEGSINHEVHAEWTLNHLSQTTLADGQGRGELYSLKLYPVEYSSLGDTTIFESVKVSYNSIQNNYWAPEQVTDHKPVGAVKYLIITHPDLVDTVKPFATWKSQKGIGTEVITTDEIDKMYDSGDLPEKMRNYVQYMESKYDLDYLLIIGDWDKVPTRITKNAYAQPMMGEPDTFASDLYFACVDPGTTWNKDSDTEYGEETDMDDYIPDMANGRLAINSPTVLKQVLHELITREKQPNWVTSNENAVYTCGDPGYMQGSPPDLMDYFWDTYGKDVFNGRDTIYYDETGTMTFDSDSFKDVMDGGQQAICYFGHGKPTEYPEFYGNSHVPQLSNNGTDGSIFAMACLTGWFDDPNQGTQMGAVENCFAETLTESPGKGVVGYIGASRIAVGYIDNTYSDDAPGLEEDYWRYIREAARGNITPTIGEVWRAAITNFASSFSPFRSQGMDNPGLRTFLEYNLLGEPDAPLIFNEPEELQLHYTLTSDKSYLDAKVTNVTGAPVENVVVTIYRHDELGRSAKTNSKGEVGISIPANNGGIINITASNTGDCPVFDTFWLPDNLAPKAVYTISPEEPDGNASYYITQPTVGLSGDEPVDVEYRWDDDEVIIEQEEVSVLFKLGDHTLHFRVKDRIGHWSDWTQVKLLVDNKPPELMIETNPGSPDGDDGWFISEPQVSLKSTEQIFNSYYKVDDGAEIQYSSSVHVDEGVHTIFFKAFDFAGNINTTELTLKVDLTPPRSELSVSHEPDGLNGYYITKPTISLISPDDSVVYYEYKWDTGIWDEYDEQIIPPEGEHSLYFRGIDSAGNVEVAHERIFMLDREAPAIGLLVDPSEPNGENGFYITAPKISITSNDGDVYYILTAGHQDFDWDNDLTLVQGSIIVPDGFWCLYAKALDPAGNEEFFGPVEYKVDTALPEFSISITPESPDGENGWYRSCPSFELICDSPDTTMYWAEQGVGEWEAFSGLVSIMSGQHKLHFKAIDQAGNVFQNQTEWIKVDIDSPQVTINEPMEEIIYGTFLTVNWSGFDMDSGIGQYKYKLDDDSWEDVSTNMQIELTRLSDGSHEIHISATDLAGNSHTISQIFKVDGIAPEMDVCNPMGKNVVIDSEIMISFSKEMQRDTVNIKVGGISGTITWLDDYALFTPDQKFEYSTKYRVTVTGTDLYNNSITQNSWSFITEDKPESDESASFSLYSVVLGGIILCVVIAGYLTVKHTRKRSK